MHRGHCYLIEQVKAEAARRGLMPIVITFEEHPRLALSQTRYWPELLTTNAQKLQLLAQTGLAACAMLHFDHTMSMLTSREFMELVLKKELNVQCLLIGYDHHFGSDLSAGYKDYVKYGKELGIDVLRERPSTPTSCASVHQPHAVSLRVVTSRWREPASAAPISLRAVWLRVAMLVRSWGIPQPTSVPIVPNNLCPDAVSMPHGPK